MRGVFLMESGRAPAAQSIAAVSTGRISPALYCFCVSAAPTFFVGADAY
jgi:hypothetical protein